MAPRAMGHHSSAPLKSEDTSHPGPGRSISPVSPSLCPSEEHRIVSEISPASEEPQVGALVKMFRKRICRQPSAVWGASEPEQLERPEVRKSPGTAEDSADDPRAEQSQSDRGGRERSHPQTKMKPNTFLVASLLFAFTYLILHG